MPVALKVTAALKFYTSASFQRPTGDLCGVTQSAVHCCIREVTDALFQRAVDYIRFTMDPGNQAERATSFCSIVGFPQVQGVIDCTHVAIKAPAGRPAEYVNRKFFHSTNVQLVCDHRKRFMQICARFPGSCHDTFILCQSQLPLLFTEMAQMEGWLLGDNGFLHRSGGALQYRLESVARIVAVCCALHNYTVNSGEALQDEERHEQDSSSDNDDAEILQQGRHMGGRRTSRHCMQAKQRAKDARQRLIAQRFSTL
ncbi:putative nuclease HARBI1 [Heterodontus francisci]|uniref:putative nuclease HARBI1 n=1 Tax=Heterodontus francisci TaxID=7792 RepID=UPI00355C0405